MHLTDPYVRKAQGRGYRSRAAFKLLEIHEKDDLIKPGMTIVDLGSAPGSWSQVLREIMSVKRTGDVGKRVYGKIFALDILPMEPIADVDFLEGDFREEAVAKALGDHQVDPLCAKSIAECLGHGLLSEIDLAQRGSTW